VSEALLALQDVSVRLSERDVLQNISFALPRRSMVALVGPNGAGKTTLLKAIAGLLPHQGTVHVGDNDVAKLSIRERAKKLSYLPQGHVVHWPLSVRDVVALGRYPHGATDPARLNDVDGAAVSRAMALADLGALADRNVTELSGGERSRVALARVIAVEAAVILADEPMASLDPRYQIDAMRLLRRIANDGALVIVVSHELGLAARFADSVMVLSQGRLVVHGTPHEALNDTVLAETFRVTAFRAQHLGNDVVVPWAET
jgi:iron complex transport system ATP-binding protein